MLSPITIVSLNQGKSFADELFSARGGNAELAEKEAKVSWRFQPFIDLLTSLVLAGRRWAA